MAKARRIFIAATMQNDGKTTVSLGLIMALKKRFKRVGFIKPIGQRYLVEEGYKVDEDSVLIEDICGIKCRLKDMSPIAIEHGFTEWYIAHGKKRDLIKRIKDSYGRIAEGMDLVVIEGTGHAGVGSCFDLSNAAVAKVLNAPVVLVTVGGIGRPIDEVMLNAALFEKEGVRLKGVIVNKIIPKKFDRISRALHSGFMRKGIEVYGVMPYKKFLAAPTMAEILDVSGGRLLCGRRGIGNSVTKVLVGAMEPREALQYMEDGSLIITPGDRGDIISAAVGVHLLHENEVRIAGILLTGGLLPNKKILNLVKRSKIPMIMAEPDTYSVASAVNKIIVKLKPQDKLKIATAIRLVEEYVDVGKIVKEL